MMQKNSNAIKDMFNKISPKYVLMNKIITFGQDDRWRRELIRLSGLKDGNSLLDIATGTGDVIFEAIQKGINLDSATGLDFSTGMLNVAKSRMLLQKKSGKKQIVWIEGDAVKLPFKKNKFDVITSAYLMRNVDDIESAFNEQFRVLKPGGRVACLDTTPPAKSIILPFINFYLIRVIPLLGTLISGNRSAYTYLPETTKSFKTAEELKEMMISSGFKKVSYKKYMFGTIAVHWGNKPLELSSKTTVEQADE